MVLLRVNLPVNMRIDCLYFLAGNWKSFLTSMLKHPPGWFLHSGHQSGFTPFSQVNVSEGSRAKEFCSTYAISGTYVCVCSLNQAAGLIQMLPCLYCSCMRIFASTDVILASSTKHKLTA